MESVPRVPEASPPIHWEERRLLGNVPTSEYVSRLGYVRWRRGSAGVEHGWWFEPKDAAGLPVGPFPTCGAAQGWAEDRAVRRG